VEQLRQVALELQMAPIRAAVLIPFVHRAFGPDGNPVEGHQAKSAQTLLDQLAWWAQVLREGRERHGAPGAAPSPTTPR
jgi:hypothetical protein